MHACNRYDSSNNNSKISTLHLLTCNFCVLKRWNLKSSCNGWCPSDLTQNFFIIFVKNIKKRTKFFFQNSAPFEAVWFLNETGMQVSEMKIGSAENLRFLNAIDMILLMTVKKSALYHMMCDFCALNFETLWPGSEDPSAWVEFSWVFLVKK